MIALSGVSVAKAGRTILANLDLRLPERRIGVVGRNGSGKSTFARLLNGLETPTGGTVSWTGPDGSQAQGKALRRHVGFVFQNPDNQIVYPVVTEDLAFGLKNLKLSKAEIVGRIDEVLTRFAIAHLAERFTHQLSGGEKQLVALAGVLVLRPSLIVLDEPTTLLDLWNKRRFMEVLAKLEPQLVVVSHDLDLIAGFDRVLHIEDGRIAGDGTPATVLAAYTARSQ